jgi:PEP-CTERM motif
MKLSTLAVVAAALGLAAVGGQAQATVVSEPGAVIDIHEGVGDVVATASGSLDLTGLTLGSPGLITTPGFVSPADGVVSVGAGGGSFNEYVGISGPASFGTGSFTPGSSGSGGPVGVERSASPFPFLIVPFGYVSGSPLSGSSTFDGTIASLGLRPGTYVYTWGSSPSLLAEDGSLTVVVGAGAIPEPGTWAMMMLGFVGLGLASYRAARKRAAFAA